MAYATFDDFVEFMTIQSQAIDASDWPDPQVLQRDLDMVAAEIDVARASSGQLTGTVGQGVDKFLQLLNIIGAVLITDFSNIRSLPAETLERYQKWKDENLKLIREGDTVLIAGETNADYPAIEVAEIAWTPATALDIIVNQIKRSSV